MNSRAMNKLLLTSAVLTMVGGIAPTAAADRGSPFELRTMPGFGLYDPAYRPSGDGLEVEVRVCRISGWAASSPGRLHILRAGGDGLPEGHRDIALRRLGLRSGENCDRVVTRFPGPYRSPEQVTICLAYSHRRCD